jgi:hypothetical protein
LGQVIIGGNLTKAPSYSGLDLVQMAFIASTRSRITAKRDANAVPWSAISSAFQPAPMPNRNRPPETWSSVATAFAVWIGSRCTTRQMPVATFNRFVTAAAAASVTKGSITS